MRIRNKQNQGVVEVSDEFGRYLVEGGAWELVEAPARRRTSRARKEE